MQSTASAQGVVHRCQNCGLVITAAPSAKGKEGKLR